MNFEIKHKNLFEGSEDGIILTVDGAAREMEGNLARAFARLNSDAWEEVEFDIEYPIPLGTSKVYEVHPDIECNNRYCFIASTLNHLNVLSDEEKLKIQSSALRHVLSLAEAKGIRTISTAILVGGWRLELEVALEEMISTYRRAASISNTIPSLSVYVLASSEFERIEKYLQQHHSDAVFSSGHIKFS